MKTLYLKDLWLKPKKQQIQLNLCKTATQIGFQDQVFKTNYCLMQVKSIAEREGSILQYFGPSLSYHLSLRSLFCLFLSGGFSQILLYIDLAKYRVHVRDCERYHITNVIK